MTGTSTCVRLETLGVRTTYNVLKFYRAMFVCICFISLSFFFNGIG